MDRLMEQVSAEDWLDSLSIFWDYGYTINDVNNKHTGSETTEEDRKRIISLSV